ncbi:MAG: DUF4249 domain-containing protein [Bacteroidetes bacterium]|jgi:hypothetical protein|nr:DUF4249 domain-containing protein [Bacteroidota bacterium]MBT3748974.1 DUF4249 domain-containing protein [Bacteroidota bacterium]MBT4400119.1 DUF4249 domain-containing protein [Bacteroidota bacterium]MBT4411112.1 DUF4249 domain-containing protein [Bacteroidota bacterium]MBT5425697.1 DUF4249 domain-containing protein [Bacteroidota bacterium]
MSSNKLFIFSFLFIGMLFQSCEKQILLDIVENESKIVVIGEFNPDSSIVVSISKSFSHNFLKCSLPPDDVVVKLYENGQYTSELSHLRNSYFGLEGFYPVVGNTYQLVVSSGELPPVSCETMIPKPAQILALDTSMNWRRNYRTELSLRLTMADSGEEENYYALMLYQSHQQIDYEHDIAMDSLVRYVRYANLEGGSEFSEHISVLDVDDDIRFGDKLFFSDLLFNGRQTELEFSLDIHSFDLLDSVMLDISLFEISKSYYLFVDSYNDYLQTRGNPFAEQVQVFGNVEEGLGLLASSAGSTHRIVIKKE